MSMKMRDENESDWARAFSLLLVIDWLFVWLIGWLVDWLVGWLDY